MTGVLEGIRVLDFTERIQGPYGTQMLADLGAEVVKVERVGALTPDGRPDDRYPPDGERTLYTSMFLSANRNKKSLALDLKSPRGLEVASRLVERSDVVYENFRPGVMDRLGLGYDRCRELNPSIVYASATGYGPDGPYAHKPGQDVLAQALGGIGAINVSAEGRPTPVGMSITDVMGGMNGAFAVVAALLHRERTGEGQHVRVSLLASAIAAQSEQAVHFLNTSVGEPVRGSVMHAHPYIPPPYGFYATKDGYLALSSGRQVSTLCRVLGIDDLTLDPRFDSYWKRDANRLEFEQIVEDSLRTRTTDEWLELMEGADMYAARVNSFAETFSDAQVEHAGLVVEIDSPIGPLKLVAPPFTFSRTPATVRTAPPRHGEHTDEVLASAGYDADAIAVLRADGAVS
ncbi:CoA transferase [Geodermatophilus sp. YIM 151500]|uniref:CaiB/BaiF CoA transferase family protein n=1 Tax=Geodermatophilus sp. YIM 151500 TaxID=2984531 RepID=UPI0021E4B567|nr:CaiB/BaiF CoA-transferase family protein [Geodermatophilus sp. YIM 151500]MCV2489294.1 CoA transferase [Geodermatophilus sp. YIM 151500]